jgi:ketosteroid isomerase-like protein
MRNRSVLVAALMLLGACRARGGTGELTRADAAAVRALDTLFATAMNAGDTPGVARTYDVDAWLLAPGATPIKGREGIRGFWGGFLRSYDVRLTLGTDQMDGRGSLAYVVGHYHMETRPKSAEVPALPPEDGKFLEVLKRGLDGHWSYVADTYSSNAPPK